MSDLNYLFVINPISGGNDKSLIYRFIEEEKQGLGFSYEIYNTTAIDDESTISKLVKLHNPKVVVAVGGDGTLLLVAKILQNTSIKIGLMPFGSANGMSKELNIPKISDIILTLNPSERFRDCWKVIQKERTKEVDLLQINNSHYALHLSDIGLNAKIVKRFEAEKIRGYFGYARLFFKELKQKKRISYRLVADGKNYKGKAYMIVIANASKYGTGAIINPVGKLDDGFFEICIVKQITFFSLMSSFSSIFRKNFQPNKELVKIISCQKAIIELKKFETLQVDGEVVGDVKKVEIEILPKALKIIS